MGIPVWRLTVVVIVVLTACCDAAKNTYVMDSHQDCGYIGVQDVQRDQTITVSARTTDSTQSSQGGCTINFRAIDSDAHLQLDFISFYISEREVSLSLSGDGSSLMTTYDLSQGTVTPRTYFSDGRSITMTLSKTNVKAMNYDFQIKLTAVRELQYLPGDTNPAATGMVIGVAGGVIVIIIVVVCAGVCCFRKYRTGGTTNSPYLYDPNSKSRMDDERSHTSVGYTNESLRVSARGSPASKKKLLAPSDSSSDEKADSNYRNRPNTLNLRTANGGRMNNRSNVPAAPPAPQINGYSKSSNVIDERPERDYGRNVFNFDEKSSKKYSVDKETNGRGSMLNALHSNPKFRHSFSENEIDAEKRAKRISSSSVEKVAPWPESSDDNRHPPKLPSVPRSPKSPKSKHARIKRTPRPTSVSSEELAQIARGRNDSDDDPNIRIVKDESVSSSSEIVSIKVNKNNTDDRKKVNRYDADDKKKSNTTHSLKPDKKGPRGLKKQTQSVSSALDPEPIYDETASSSSDIGPRNGNNDTNDKKKANTTHSLKPDRKGGRGQKKQTQSVSSALDPEPAHVRKTQRDRVASVDGALNESFETQGSGRYNKRPSKSPKSRIKGFGHRRGRRDDQSDSRPTTPTSAFGSTDDLESLPPLGRAGSKSSLYSSRTSLYDRRGNRRRKGSYPESVSSSYTRDDISVMRHSRDYYDDDEYFDGYEKPLSRRDKERIFRSDTDIGRTVSTQTLRETATQTGPDESVTFEPKVVVKKKRRSRSVSSSGTQTASKKSADDKAKVKTGEPLSPKTKTKRSKSVNVTDDIKRSKSVEGLETKTKGRSSKPKLKPKPRKSTSADSILDDREKSASKENLAGNMHENPYYPKSEGFAVEGYPGQPYPGYPAYPNVAQGYPGPPGAGYPTAQYPGQPGMQYPPPNISGVPPGYPQNMYPQPAMTNSNVLPSSQPANEPRKPRKSNWEMLVELTDGEYQGHNRDDVTETGSVASSVFTNNPHSVPGYGGQTENQGYYAPQAGYQPQQFGYQPPQQFVQTSQAQPQPNKSGKRDEATKKQSSWEALEEITGPRGQVNVTGNTKTETII